MPATYRLSHVAYSKLVLHAAKHSVCEVSGVLIGRKKSGDEVEVVDAVPLFHSRPLAPMLEVALQQVQLYCDQNSLQVVGLYAANQGSANKDVSAATSKIAGKIDDNLGGGAILLMLDAAKLKARANPAVIPYTQTAGGWTVLQSNYLVSPPNPVDLVQLIRDRVYAHINDFDSHLDNIKLDWLANDVVAKAFKA
ncbi:ER membrane protein complex subunit 8 [Geranomyces variabilis]|uniref:ER membrane protein complex subunit 8 n=1 Tax=Geranomyces variabilis TaxID=109894 RepID=A0AAD5TD40_9FUNG|nr:ER membrane protein complex subunit 8 [Geranomyces variabilis]